MRFAEGDEAVRFGLPLGPPSSAAKDRRGRVSCASAHDALLASVANVALGPHCFIEFSGGCDSSLVLSAATVVRRRAGLPDPVPITFHYAGGESEELSYQEAVVGFLGLSSWKVVDLETGADFLGPTATTSLRQAGLFWPSTLHYKAAIYDGLPPGSTVLNGEGGDEVFGSRRITPVFFVAQRLRHRIRPSRRALNYVAAALSPLPVRFREMVTTVNENYGAEWLLPTDRRSCIRRIARLEASEPLRPTAWPDFYLSLPRTRIVLENITNFGRLHGVEVVSPLLNADFMADVARYVRWHLYGDRSAILNRYFAELLPDIILNRTTKATFGTSYFGPYTRAFAERWDGSGLPEGVDAQWLKHHWMTADVCHAGTSMLLQAAWLATEGASDAAPAAQV